MKTKYIFLAILIAAINSQVLSATFTWTGNTSSSWSVSGNWSGGGGGTPGSGDNITINSNAPNNLALTQNQTVTNFTINGDTLDLGTYSLTSTGVTYFNGGKVFNGNLNISGSLCHFGGAIIDARIAATCGYYHMNGGTFLRPVILVSTGTASTSGSGNCVFEDSLSITNNGSYYFYLGSTYADSYENLLITNNSTHEVFFGSTDTTYITGNLILNNTSTGGIVTGTGNGVTYLASGKTISIGSSGFTNNYLTLKNFYQQGSTAQTITLTGTAIFNLINANFEGNLTVTTPGILLKNSTFNGTTSITRNGTSGSFHCDGGNTFAGALTLDNAGTSGRVRMANTTPDTYFNDVTFNSTNGQDVQIAYTGNNIFEGNITINSNKVVFNTSNGKVTFAGGNTQSLNGSYNFPFKKLTIDKSANHATANTTLSVDDSLIFILGNIITTSSNLLTMKNGSTSSGASNSSFVNGPVKKVGNTAFEFPVGKGSYFQNLKISAPSNASDAFTSEYFKEEQLIGFSRDTSLDFINRCQYWTLLRNVGSSTVSVQLSWQTATCELLDSLDSRIVGWDGTKWKDYGHSSFTGTKMQGTLSNSTTVNAYNYFTIGYNMSSQSYLPQIGICVGFNGGSNIGCSDTPGSVSFGSYCEGKVFDFYLDDFTKDFIAANIGNSTNYCLQWLLPGSNCSNPTSCISYFNPTTCSYLTAGTYSISAQIINISTGLPVMQGGGSGYTITILDAPNPTISGTLSLCSQSSTTLDAGSGYSSYLWNNMSTSQTLNVSVAGTYTVTVTNSNGCSGISTVNVTGSFFSLSIANSLPTICFGAHNGSLTVSTSGSPQTPLTIQWTLGIINFGSSTTISNLYPGTYTCTITDASGCSHQASATINQYPMMTLTMSHTDVTACSLTQNGSASVSVSGGTPGFTYLWSNSATTSSISSLYPGWYSVTVTDANGCSLPGSVYVDWFDGLDPTVSGPTSECASSYIYSITNSGDYPTNTTFSWEITTGAGMTILTGNPINLSTTPLVAGNTIIGFANNNGCSFSSVVITIQECCDAVSGYFSVNDIHLDDFRTLVGISGLNFTYDGIVNTNGPNIIINGTFDYNMTLPFRFENCNFIMGPGSRILNSAGGSMRFKNCNFVSCENLWQGMELATATSIQLENCVIEDAYYAIWQRKPSAMTLTDVIFDNNYIGVKYGSFGNLLGSTYPIVSTTPGTYNRVKFYSTKTLKSAYPGLIPIPSMPANHGYAGVYAEFVFGLDFHNDVEFGDITGATTNRLNIGIYLLFGSLIVRDNVHFGNIKREAAYGVGAPNGSAIYAHGNPREYPGDLTVLGSFGNPFWDNTTFRNCDRAIHSEYMDNNTISGNLTDNVDRGIYINHGFFEINIFENYIHANRSGIEIVNSSATTVPITFPFDPFDPQSQAIKIVGNNVYLGENSSSLFANAIGIRIAEPIGNIYATEAYLYLNSVENNFGLIGMQFQNLIDLYSIYGNVLSESDLTQYGVTSQRCSQMQIHCGSVFSSTSVFDPSIQHFGYFSSATRFQEINCTGTINQWHGYHFTGNCNNHNIIHNTIENASDCGYFLSSTARTGQQTLKGNIWTDPVTTMPNGRAAVNENPAAYVLSSVEVSPNNPSAGSGYYYYPNYNIPGNTTPGQGVWFVDNNTQDNENECAFELCSITNSDEEERFALDSLIVLDSITTSIFTDESRIMGRMYLYDKLRYNPTLRDTNTFFSEFYSAMDTTNIPDFSNIQYALLVLDSTTRDAMVLLKISNDSLSSLLYTILRNDSILFSGSLSSNDSSSLDSMNVIMRSEWNSYREETHDVAVAYKEIHDDRVYELYSNLQEISPINTIESNIKKVWSYYFQTVAIDNYNFDPEMEEEILAIAVQCPDEGGEIVYDARIIYSYIDEEYSFDDYQICNDTTSARFMNKPTSIVKKTSDFLSVHPNPADESVNIDYSIKSTGILKICDLKGVVVKTLKLEPDFNSLPISITDLAPGMYFVEMNSKDSKLTQKLSIQR